VNYLNVIEERLSFLRGGDVEASYRRAEIAKYRVNPLTEALQPIHDVPVVIKKLTKLYLRFTAARSTP
jgi:hypothetical protein